MTEQTIYRDRSAGFIASFVFHAFLLIAGSFAFLKPAEYAVDAGSGGIAISLTAAPVEAAPEAAPAAESPASAPAQTDPLPKLEDTMLMQNEIEEIKPPQAASAPEKPKGLQAENHPYKGDGSSEVPGKDATTFYSRGGALAEAKPNYLKNPAPAYPREARENGWEGVVVLKVSVGKDGRPFALEKAKGSGYDVLDQSAITTVKKWRFSPAQLGALAVESTVLVPIRFELENLRKK